MDIKPWEKLARQEQDLYLTLLWKDGYSEQKIADFLKTTKGRIVRRRQTGLKLSASDRIKKEGDIDPDRFADLLDINDMENLEAQGISSIAPPSPHEVASEPEPVLPHAEPVPKPKLSIAGCRWPLGTSTKLKPKLCGKEVVPGHEVCAEHLALINRSVRM